MKFSWKRRKGARLARLEMVGQLKRWQAESEDAIRQEIAAAPLSSLEVRLVLALRNGAGRRSGGWRVTTSWSFPAG